MKGVKGGTSGRYIAVKTTLQRTCFLPKTCLISVVWRSLCPTEKLATLQEIGEAENVNA